MDERIYISGKISGLSRMQYLTNFGVAQYDLRQQGYQVYNPALLNDTLPKETTWEEYMIISMCLLKMCRKIYMLPGWRDSKGAMVEYKYAKRHGYEILGEDL